MNKKRFSREYVQGVKDFIQFVTKSKSSDRKIPCTCKRCSNLYLFEPRVVHDHLVITNGICLGYDPWYCHGESKFVATSSRARIVK